MTEEKPCANAIATIEKLVERVEKLEETNRAQHLEIMAKAHDNREAIDRYEKQATEIREVLEGMRAIRLLARFLMWLGGLAAAGIAIMALMRDGNG